MENSSDWTTFKKIAADRYLSIQYTISSTYNIFGYDSQLQFNCTIWLGIVPDGVIESGYSQAQNDADKADFEINYKDLSNQLITSKNSDGNALVSNEPRIGKELVVITHNFCDPTTWYTQSIRITDETLTDLGSGTVWDSDNQNWIDMTHGKIFDEDAIRKDASHSYSIIVTVDGVSKTQRAPFASSGGDYTVDYALGQITSVSGSWAGKTVLASYSYESGSEWSIIPDSGYRIDIEDAEVQFSKDMIINDSIQFDAWVYNPSDLPNKILYTRTVYKTMANYIDEAKGCYPVIPYIGGTNRGNATDWFGFPFRYETIKILKSSQGAEIRVRLQDNLVFGGEHATATFYCTVRVE